MALVLLALAAGLAAGYARGGRLRRLAERPPVRGRLILTALGAYALGVAGSWAWEPLLPVMTALCWFTVGFFCWLNRSYHGALLVALGLAANGLVILLNGGMPVSVAAQTRAGVEVSSTESLVDEDGRTVAVADDTRLSWLGKAVPVAFPPRPEVVSPGDVAVAAGLAAALATAMTGRRAAPAQVPARVSAQPAQPARPAPPAPSPASNATHPAQPARPVRPRTSQPSRAVRPAAAGHPDQPGRPPQPSAPSPASGRPQPPGPPPPPPQRSPQSARRGSEHDARRDPEPSTGPSTGPSTDHDSEHGPDRPGGRATMDSDATAGTTAESPRVTA